MGQENILKKTLKTLSLIVFISVSAFTINATTPKPALAQTCVPTPCTAPGGIGGAVSSMMTSASTAAGQAATDVAAWFNSKATIARVDIFGKAASLRLNFTQWVLKFWYKKILPDMQAMAEQRSIMDAEQSRVYGGFLDAANQLRTISDFKELQLNTQRAQRVSDGTIVAATLMGGMTKASIFKKYYSIAATTEMLNRSANSTDSTHGIGTAKNIQNRWVEYETRYCKEDNNNGASGCSSDQSFANKDIDVIGTIFNKDTIDLTDPDIKKSVDDLVINIAEPFIRDPIATKAVKSSAGQNAILENESYKSRRQLIYESLYHIVSRRAPGSGIGTYVSALRTDAGINISEIGVNPSYNEILHAMINERPRTGKYALQNIDEPEANQRELVIQQALQIMQMNAQLELMDRQSLIIAAQVGKKIKDGKHYSSVLSGAKF